MRLIVSFLIREMDVTKCSGNLAGTFKMTQRTASKSLRLVVILCTKEHEPVFIQLARRNPEKIQVRVVKPIVKQMPQQLPVPRLVGILLSTLRVFPRAF